MDAPRATDSYFHGDRRHYARRSIAKALDSGQITERDRDLIAEFVTDLRAFKDIGLLRQNKLTSHLVGWRRYIGPFEANTISDLAAGINALHASSSPITGEPYAANTLSDYTIILKQFYSWMIEEGYSTIPEKKLAKVRVPPKPKMTKTAADILTPEEVQAFLSACQSSRDRAFYTLLYEAGPRVSEIGTLAWHQLEFDRFGAILNTDGKTGKPRYIRLIMSVEPLAAWRRDYPFPSEGDNLVFLNHRRRPLTLAAITKQMRLIGQRAGIKKHLVTHLFRHSRVTHLITEGVPLAVVGMMMWGDPTAPELRTYLHLANHDVDAAMLSHYGVTDPAEAAAARVEAHQCPTCKTVCGPTAEYCPRCGHHLTEEAATEVEAARAEITPELIQQMIHEGVQQGIHEALRQRGIE